MDILSTYQTYFRHIPAYWTYFEYIRHYFGHTLDVLETRLDVLDLLWTYFWTYWMFFGQIGHTLDILWLYWQYSGHNLTIFVIFWFGHTGYTLATGYSLCVLYILALLWTLWTYFPIWSTNLFYALNSYNADYFLPSFQSQISQDHNFCQSIIALKEK